MYCRSTLQHQTMWLSMKHWSTASSWPRRSTFDGFDVMEIPIWWCSNALAIGMQKMKTWQVTDSWYIRYPVSRVENEAAEALSKLGSTRKEIPAGVSLENIHKPSIKPSLESESIFILADLKMAELEAQKVAKRQKLEK